MFHVVWEFRPVEGKLAEFERVYGPKGAWAQLFSRADGYVQSILLRDEADPGRYWTIDVWVSERALVDFKARHRKAYAALDLECEALCRDERILGCFVARQPEPEDVAR